MLCSYWTWLSIHFNYANIVASNKENITSTTVHYGIMPGGAERGEARLGSGVIACYNLQKYLIWFISRLTCTQWLYTVLLYFIISLHGEQISFLFFTFFFSNSNNENMKLRPTEKRNKNNIFAYTCVSLLATKKTQIFHRIISIKMYVHIIKGFPYLRYTSALSSVNTCGSYWPLAHELFSYMQYVGGKP